MKINVCPPRESYNLRSCVLSTEIHISIFFGTTDNSVKRCLEHSSRHVDMWPGGLHTRDQRSVFCASAGGPVIGRGGEID